MERFAALRQALRGSGGIVQADDLARLLEDHRLGDSMSLARIIAHYDVFGFGFQASFWVPMFQFDLRDLSLTCGANRARGLPLNMPKSLTPVLPAFEVGTTVDAAWPLPNADTLTNSHLRDGDLVELKADTTGDFVGGSFVSSRSSLKAVPGLIRFRMRRFAS